MGDNANDRRSRLDRRSGEDRRRTYELDYFLDGGRERRNPDGNDRRIQHQERRKGWVRVSQWSSFYTGLDASDTSTAGHLPNPDIQESDSDDTPSEPGSTT